MRTITHMSKKISWRDTFEADSLGSVGLKVAAQDYTG